MNKSANQKKKAPDLASLLARGYLPRELPFLFTTSSLARVASNALRACTDGELKKWTKPMTLPIGSKGGRRRTVSIPNPISQANLSRIITTRWKEIVTHCDRSPISFSRVRVPGEERFLKNERRGDPSYLSESIFLTKQFSQKRLELAASSNYILKADISNFYGSIYTHSLGWAMHGKKASKKAAGKKGKSALLGDLLDTAVRNGNDGQTKGIPIGPDTSRILSEIIGAAIDKKLATKLKKRVSQGHEGIRWVDDFLLYFQSAGGRDKALGTLVEALEEFELSLNHHKTAYLLPGEDLIESPWVHQLRRYHFRSRPVAQFYDLLGFADLVAKLQHAHPNDSVALYASKILWSMRIAKENLADQLSVLWRLVHLDPRVVSVAAIYTVELDPDLHKTPRIKKIVSETIRFHLADFLDRRWPLETCWLLWLCREISHHLPVSLVQGLSQFDHPLVALAVLELESASLIEKPVDLVEWKNSVSDDEALTGPRWMLAYELRKRGRTRKDMSHSFFKTLKEQNVSFIRQVRPR